MAKYRAQTQGICFNKVIIKNLKGRHLNAYPSEMKDWIQYYIKGNNFPERDYRAIVLATAEHARPILELDLEDATFSCASSVPFSWGLSHKTILASFSEKLEYPAIWSSVWWNRERTKYPDGAVSGSTDGNRRALMPCFCFQCYFFCITSLKTSTELISYTAAIGMCRAELLSIISRFIFWHVRNFSNWYL